MGYWSLIEPYWGRIDIYSGPDRFLADFAEAPEAVRHLFASHFAQSEICNGGMGQLFSNSTGVLAPEAVAGFRALGLNALGDQLEAAMRLFGVPYPRERSERVAMLDGLGVSFDRDNQRFYEEMNVHAAENAFDRAADIYASTWRA